MVLLCMGCWTIVNIVSEMPDLSAQPPKFWSALAFAALTTVFFLLITATRLKHHTILYRMTLQTARYKMAIWSSRLTSLALFHSLAAVWMLVASFILECVGNASITPDDGAAVGLPIVWNSNNIPY